MPRLRHTLPLLASVAALLAPACGGEVTAQVTTSTGSPPSPNLQTVLQYIQDQMSSCTIPGAAVAVVKDGHLVDAAGVGVVSTGSSQPVTPSTLFLMGGAGEPIVGLTALSLVQEGKLDLARPVTTYVPLKLASGFDPTAITLDQVLLATAGLPEFHNTTYACGPGTIGSWFQGESDLPLWSPPGAVCNFSHMGDGLVGWVVEAVTSQTFPQATAERVLGPAGMKTATYDPTVALAGDHAVGQDVDPDSGQVTPQTPDYSRCSVMLPSDGLYASVLDYASLAETLLAGGGRMLDAASVTRFETGQVPDYLAPQGGYAYGLHQSEQFQGIDILRAGGSTGGFYTDFWLVPSKSFAVVVVFNADNPTSSCSPFEAAELAMQTYLGLSSSDGAQWTTPTSAWTPYLGTYLDSATLGTVEVSLSGDQLLASVPNYGSIALTESYATAFNAEIASNSVTVTFQADGSGAGGWFVTPYGVARRQ